MHIITWEVTLSSRIVRTSWQKTRPCVRKKEVKEERKEEKEGGWGRNRPNHMHTTVTGDIHACIHQALIYTLKHCSSELTLIKDSRSNFPLFFLKEITSVAEKFLKLAENEGVVLYSGHCWKLRETFDYSSGKLLYTASLMYIIIFGKLTAFFSFACSPMS